MPKNIPITLACGDYDILQPLLDGRVRAEGVDLTFVTNLDSFTRHSRFLQGGEFDAAELSGSSYLMAKDRGLSIDAIPVFPHRRFRHGFVFINTGAGIKAPKDLAGKRVGVKSFQATAMLWIRGILEHDYGLQHRSMTYFSDLDEDIAFDLPQGLHLTRLPAGKKIEQMVVDGELDAVLHTDMIPAMVAKDKRVARLFPNHLAEEKAYFRKTGIFPIMHVVGLRQSLVERYPWLPVNLYKAFDEAKAEAMQRMLNPRIVPLAWYNEFREEQEELLGPDPWEYDLTDRNRANIGAMVAYSHEQGLIKRKLSMEELFVSISEGRKRGGFKI